MPATKSVTISVPPDLLDEIDARAKQSGRSRSNWITRELAALCDCELPDEYAPRAKKLALEEETKAKRFIAANIDKAKPTRKRRS